MTIYVPRHFEATERVSIARVLHDYPFATLLTPTPGAHDITHLPLVYVADPEPHGTLFGHVARANPHWRRMHQAESTAIFQGPHHYVSPSWYSEPAAAVPTWNYAVVHVHGAAELVESRSETEGILQLMVGRFESALPEPWSLSLPEEQLAAMLGAIVAFRIRIRRIDAKFKLSQNRAPLDRRRVAAALKNLGSDEGAVLAEWMGRYAAR
jgi:transcriptional regulator